MIKQTGLARDVPPWRVADHVGPQGTQIILIGGNPDLSRAIPGLYTYEGYYNAFLPALAEIAPNMARDGWIMGTKSQIANDDATIQSIMRDVISIYVNDYVDQWTQLLGQIGLATPRSKEEARGYTNILAGPTSPLKNLLSDIARQTKLTPPPGAAQGQVATPDASQIEKLGQQELSRLLGSKGRGGYLLNQLFLGGTATGGGTGGAGGEEAKPPEQRVEERFKFLHDYVGGSPAPIDEAIQAINAVYLALNNALSQPVPTQGPDSALNAAVQQLSAAAGRAPASVAAQLTGFADTVATIEKGAVSGSLNDNYQSAVVPFCSKMVANRYPIFADGSADVTLDDFSRLFAPGGVLDSFFKANLMQYVDTSRVPWRAQGGLAISPGALEQFRIAGLLRDSMFALGNSPSARFEVVPLALDNGATQVLLEVDGQSVTYSHGPQVPVQMQWPGTGVKQARISFQPQAPNSSITKDGPWALFRLFDQGTITPGGGPDRFTVTFNVGGHNAAFEIRAGSVLNPFSLKELHKFRCPGKI
jgi:type VI secretion system protein ImpL